MTSLVQDTKTEAQNNGIIDTPVTTVQPGSTAQPEATVTTVQPPPGAPPGGKWIEDNYSGALSCLACLFIPAFGMCILCCCPIDSRTVYVVDQKKYNQLGNILPS
ncbi:unnamed protein product [Ectocarpus sp. 4 AP-2014]